MTDRAATLKGIVAALLAMVLFSTMDAVIKGLRDDYGTVQIFFFRSLFGLLPILVLLRGSGVAALRTKRLGGHVARALLMIAFLLCFFFGLQLMPLADAYAITFAAPLFITALSVPLLGERVGGRRWAAVLVGFVGVLIVLRPGSDVLSSGGFVMLAGAALYSLAMIFVRQLSRTETQAAIVFYFTVTSIVLSGLALPFGWTTPAPADWLPLVGIGLIGGTGQILITRALAMAPASVIGPFQYTQLIWGVLFGYIFFGDVPGGTVLLGGAVIAASGVYILHRETLRGAPAQEVPSR